MSAAGPSPRPLSVSVQSRTAGRRVRHPRKFLTGFRKPVNSEEILGWVQFSQTLSADDIFTHIPWSCQKFKELSWEQDEKGVPLYAIKTAKNLVFGYTTAMKWGRPYEEYKQKFSSKFCLKFIEGIQNTIYSVSIYNIFCIL